MATKQPTQLCYQVNGGTCRNKVSKEKGYVCSAGHRPGANQVAPIAIASIQQVPPKVDLSKMKVAEKLELAKNESLTEDMQRILAEDKDKDVRRALAENPSLVEDLQVRLAKDKYSYVREALAWNPSLIEDLQKRLAKDKDVYVRQALAWNPSLVEELQKRLAEDKDVYVRRALAWNPSLVEELQKRLAEDKDKDVRRALAENPSLTLPVSIALAEQGYAPYGFARSKSTEELWAHKNLIMTGDYQSQFGEAFLNRLVNLNYTKPEDKIGQLAEQRKLLILLAFYKYAGAEGEGKNEISGYRDKILNIFPDDQEIAYLIST